VSRSYSEGVFDQRKTNHPEPQKYMKLTLKEKIRLAQLKSATAELTADEKTELAALEAKAKAADENIDEIVKNFAPDPEEEIPVDAKALMGMITKAVKDSLPAESGVDTAKLVSEIEAAFKASKGLTPAEVEAIVVKHAGGTSIDKAALVAAVKEAMGSNDDSLVTKAEFKKFLDDFAANMKQERATQFNDGKSAGRELVIEHRSGNMTPWEKQLLNLCLMNVSENAKDATIKAGGTIPTSLNDGIAEDILKAAAQRGRDRLKSLRQSVVHGGKTLTTTGAGSGLELIPTDLSSQLYERFYLESQLAAEFMSSEIDMPTDPFKFPMTTTRPNYYVGAEAPGSDPTASNPGTAGITLDAVKLIGMSDYSYEADEDSIIAVLNIIMNGLTEGAASAYESALLEGDTSATHQHSDYHAIAGHHAKMFKGFRKLAIAGGLTKDLSTGNVNWTNIKAMRKLMKKYGVKPRDLMLVAGPMAYNDLVGLDETLTFEKVGNAAAARILTGEASSIGGIRIVVSGELREDLNASGVYDGSTTTKGSLLLINRSNFLVGVRRGFTLEVDVDKKRQINYVIASFRRAFTPKEAPAANTMPTVVLGYNNNAAA